MLVQRPTTPNRSLTSLTPFDRAFTQLTRDLFAPVRRQPDVDAAWQDGSLVLTVDLPGVSPEHVSVQVADRTLTISVAEQSGTEASNWQRSFRLGAALDPDSVHAHHLHGRLTVTVNEQAAPTPRTIEIDTTVPAAPVAEAHEAAALEVTSTDDQAGLDTETSGTETS